MRILTRAKVMATRTPRRKRAEEFDQAVAEFFMRIALEEAARGVGRTSPNPAVGAILVKAGRIIARGYHRKAGTPHAEIVALEAAGPRARGADLYTTLEPCDHFGRTPPCSVAIVNAGVRRVVSASSDPNPLVNGRGLQRLKDAGIQVVTGVLRAEADKLNRPFFKYIRTGMPWVTLKAAVTLDGKLATATGDSRWVTGEQARAYVHRLRDQVDVVMVGTNTVERDNPQLTTRLPDPGGRDPLRLVVDSHLRLSPRRKLFTQRSSARTVIATLEAADGVRARPFLARGVEVWTVPGRQGRVNVKALLKRLATQGSLHVLVEGGSELFGTLIRQKLADELLLFLAPKVLGSSGLSWAGELGIVKMARALQLSHSEVERHGADVLIRSLF